MSGTGRGADAGATQSVMGAGMWPLWNSLSTGALDAHMGAVGVIQPGTMVKIMGTSTCDIVVAPLQDPLPYISVSAVWLKAFHQLPWH